MSARLNVKTFHTEDNSDDRSIFSAFSPSFSSKLHESFMSATPGTVSSKNGNSKDHASNDWQSQRYKKAMQRSREVKQQRKSVAPMAQTPTSQPPLSNSVRFQQEWKENSAISNSSTHRAIIDTSMAETRKKSPTPKSLSKSPIQSGGEGIKDCIPSSITTVKVSDDMRRVLSTISTNSPPRIHGLSSTQNAENRGTSNKSEVKKKSPKKSSFENQSIPSQESDPFASIDTNRHFQSLAKTVQDKMTLNSSSFVHEHARERLTEEFPSQQSEDVSQKNYEASHPDTFSNFVQELKREVSQDHKEVRFHYFNKHAAL